MLHSFLATPVAFFGFIPVSQKIVDLEKALTTNGTFS